MAVILHQWQEGLQPLDPITAVTCDGARDLRVPVMHCSL